jgi:hypothetical protein
MVESDIVLLYIWSCVLGIIYVVGPGVATVQTPQRPFLCDVRQWLGALSMHAAPPGIWIVCGTRKSDSPIRAS